MLKTCLFKMAFNSWSVYVTFNPDIFIVEYNYSKAFATSQLSIRWLQTEIITYCNQQIYYRLDGSRFSRKNWLNLVYLLVFITPNNIDRYV